MKLQNVLYALGVAAIAVPLLKALYDWAQSPAPTTRSGNSTQVVKMVGETLHQHSGEESPFVHAFEAALEEEAHHDKALARAAGLPA